MISPTFRAIALLVLILSFALLSGIATTLPALAHPERVDACCDGGGTEPEPLSGSCAAADCLCISCLAIDLTAPIPQAHLLPDTAAVFYPPRPLCPDGFSATIDYPPEVA